MLGFLSQYQKYSPHLVVALLLLLLFLPRRSASSLQYLQYCNEFFFVSLTEDNSKGLKYQFVNSKGLNFQTHCC